MKTYVFLDLDDTLFQTLRKCPTIEGLEAVGFSDDGTPLSYLTPQQRELFRRLSRATVIPATARSLAAFGRIKLPFTSLTILDFGGVVLLPDGTLDQSWDAIVRPQAWAAGDFLESALRQVERYNQAMQLNVKARIIFDFGMPLYLVVKHPQGNVEALHSLRDSEAWPSDRQYFTHFNDNNLSLVPRFLGKERAVQHVIDAHLDRSESLLIGCADSESDAPFLGLCDFAIIPRHSQLFEHMQRSLERC